MNYKRAYKYWDSQIKTEMTAEFFAGKIIKVKKSQRYTYPARMQKKLARLKYRLLYMKRDTGHYILRGHGVKKEPDLLEWGEWFQEHPRSLKRTTICDSVISTVFLGLNHNYFGDKPILFETMIFVGGHGGDMRRYSTWDEAIIGHWKMVEEVRSNTMIH